jgi:hypothetical protein
MPLALTAILGAGFPWATATGATTVAGPISSNTTWTQANSPYLLDDEVQVTNGAYLTIQPGVVVQADADGSLTVVNGALSAQGTSDHPIVFTSSSHEPSGWGPLKFAAGTLNASSTLSHVTIQYGRGLVIESASPTLSDLRIDDNEGPAITLDLKASPIGQRISASGNALNGILVPAGEIATDVTWALKGIPYVVTQGTVFVGQSGFRLTPSRLQLAAGVTGALELSIPEPAPAGGLAVDVVSSVPSCANVSSGIVTIPEGQRTATVAVQAFAPGTTTITASRAGFSNTTATVKVVAAPGLTLAPSTAVVGVGKTVALTLSLSDIAPAGGLEVDLGSSDALLATVPASVVVPAGDSRATFEASGVAPGQAVVTASAVGYQSGTANLTVRPASVNLPAQFLVAPSASRSLPVLLSDPAPAGGLTVTLVSANPAVATLPATVTLAEGASAANVDVAGVAVGATTLTASAPGYEPGSSDVTVDAISIALTPAGNISIPVNLTQSYAVRLSKAAPAGGVDVALSIVDAVMATVTPATVHVPEGQTVAAQSILLTGVAVGTTQLSASSPGLSSLAVPVQVTPAAKLEFSHSSATVGKGLVTYLNDRYVRLRTGSADYVPQEPLTISLTSSDPGKATVPATVTVPAGSSRVNFSVTGVDLASATIDASASGYTSPATKLTANVVAPTLVVASLDGNRSVTSVRDDFYLSWQPPSGMNTQTAAATQTFALSTVEADPAGIIAGYYDAVTGGNAIGQLTIFAGRSNSLYTATGACCQYGYVGQPTAAGTYKVAASLPGVGNWASGPQTVTTPELRFSRSSLSVGKGLVTYLNDTSVQLYVNGQAATTAAALTVSLTSSDPGKATVPATVTVPAGSSRVNFSVTGVDLASVTIDASASGYTSPATKLTANVVAPTLVVTGLDGNRSVTSVRDDFYLSWQPPSGMNAQTAAATQTFALSTVEADPAGIIAGYYDAETGDNAIGQLTIAAGRSDSRFATNGACCQYAYVSQPTAAGTYKVAASLPGVGNWASGPQTVTTPELRFSRSSLSVGKGLVTYLNDTSVQLYVNGQAATTAAALTVSLTSSDPGKATVPATVTVPAGSSRVNFSVTGVDLASVTIDASASGYTSPATKLTANVVAPTLVVTGLDGNRSVTSVRDDFYLSWQPPSGMNAQTAAATQTFALSTVEADPAGIIAGYYDAETGDNAIGQLTIVAGRSDSRYGATGTCCQYGYVGQPTTAGTYKVAASLPGVGNWPSAPQTVANPELRFSIASSGTRGFVGKGLKTHPSEVAVCQTADGHPVRGATILAVQLACAATNVCMVPASVSIPAGTSCVNFQISGTGLGSTRVVPFATGHLVAQELDVSVVTPNLRFNGLLAALNAGATDDFTISIETPGAAYSQSQTAIDPIPIALTSATPSVATVTASVTIQGGQTTSGNARITAVGAGTTTLTASGSDINPSTSPTVTVGP